MANKSKNKEAPGLFAIAGSWREAAGRGEGEEDTVREVTGNKEKSKLRMQEWQILVQRKRARHRESQREKDTESQRQREGETQLHTS